MTQDGAVGQVDERRAQGVIELQVSQLETSLSFYTAIGFAIERRHGDFVALTGHGCRLFLVRDASVPETWPRGCNLRIVVDDVDATRRRIEEAGLPIARELADRRYGLRDFSIAAPDGFHLRFAQLLP